MSRCISRLKCKVESNLIPHQLQNYVLRPRYLCFSFFKSIQADSTLTFYVIIYTNDRNCSTSLKCMLWIFFSGPKLLMTASLTIWNISTTWDWLCSFVKFILFVSLTIKKRVPNKLVWLFWLFEPIKLEFGSLCSWTY